MPYIVRLFLQKQAEVDTKKGSECSGTIIDNHWIATSFACCENIVAFKLLDFGRNRMMKVDQGIIGIGPLKIQNEEYDVCLIRTRPLRKRNAHLSGRLITVILKGDSYEQP